MANHTARLGLLALLVFAAAVHVSADLSELSAAVGALEGPLAAAKASLGAGRRDAASRGDVTSCWSKTSLICSLTSKCTASKCECCGCACATFGCWFSQFKALQAQAAKTAAQVKTPAQRAAAAKVYCDLKRTSAPLTKDLIALYQKAQCPGYTSYVKSLQGFQANYTKWCKAFSG